MLNGRLTASVLAATAVLFVLPSAALLLSGRLVVVITHGISMNPVYYEGDLVVVADQDAYAVGDIAAFPKPGDEGTLVLHRIIGGDAESGFVFQGDNNTSIDPVTPTADELVGSAVLHVPGGGTWLHRLTSAPALAAYAFLLLTLGGTATRTRRQRRKELREMSPRHRAVAPGVTASLPDRLKPVAAGAALMGLTGLALGGVAWTRDAQQTVQAADSTDSSMTFGYTAVVPPSPAYDGTTVTAPQPIFRKLTETVDVTYRYAGPVGQLRVHAELSTASGWSSTVPLSEPVDVDEQFAGSVTLDLAWLEQRAVEAAAVTGLPAGGLTIAVVPTVARDAGGQFAPRLELGMDPLVLKPMGDLSATETTTTTGERVQSAQLAALGRRLDVATARVVGGVLALVGLLAAVAVAVATRLFSPPSETQRVRRRYNDLILTVMPVALIAGRPVVDVPDVDSLVKLAERYGLLVLTWSRGGIDTYVVQDESTTYRYRSGAGQTHTAPFEQDTGILQSPAAR